MNERKKKSNKSGQPHYKTVSYAEALKLVGEMEGEKPGNLQEILKQARSGKIVIPTRSTQRTPIEYFTLKGKK